MGQLDRFGKRTFASDTTPVTHGVFGWNDAAEIGLSHIQPDGYLVVLAPERLTALPAPWSEAQSYPGEILVELKMPGDHLDWTAIYRAELRRLTRQIQRSEDAVASWNGLEPLWIVAPHVPAVLSERHALTRVAAGCYRIDTGRGGFPFLWIAANELPLCEELIPFLVARSGKPKDEFALWVAERRPLDWLLDMVHFTPMSTAVQNELLERIRRSDDPEVRRRHLEIVRKMLEGEPDLQQEIRLEEARANLRRVLARRGLTLSIADDAQIEACSDLGTLEHWLEEAVTAPTTSEVLR